MEAKLLLDNRGLSSTIRVSRKLMIPHNKPAKCSPVGVVAVLKRPSATTGNTMISTLTDTTTTTIHQDNWFDRIAIHHLSQSIQLITGMKNEKRGYESLVEAATTVARSSGDINSQQELVLQALNKAFPKPILSLIRFLLPQSKFTREYFAMFTTLFFAWLVGPCEVKESEVKGRMEKNVVHIKKCRFLEESNCVGMCINLCKMPSQKFIKDSFGMPVYMVPNFDDMSCDMIYGQDPPAPADDPAFRQPCFKTICKAKQKHTSGCSTL